MATPEFEPPQASISRIIKNVLPPNVMVTKDARAAFTRAASIFIFYLTHCANDFSRESKRQTIYLQDVKNALRELDFEDFEAPLEEFLELYRKAQREAIPGSKSASRTKVAASGVGGTEGDAGDAGEAGEAREAGEGEGDSEGDDADMQQEVDDENDDAMAENDDEEEDD